MLYYIYIYLHHIPMASEAMLRCSRSSPTASGLFGGFGGKEGGPKWVSVAGRG